MRCLKSLLVMVEKMSKIRDSKGVFSVVVADLCEAFDCILRGLLIAILNAFIAIKKTLFCISAYLCKRKQKTKVGSEFGYLVIGVVLVFLLLTFNIFDTFF